MVRFESIGRNWGLVGFFVRPRGYEIIPTGIMVHEIRLAGVTEAHAGLPRRLTKVMVFVFPEVRELWIAYIGRKKYLVDEFWKKKLESGAYSSIEDMVRMVEKPYQW